MRNIVIDNSICTVKLKEWEYEQEYRIYTQFPPEFKNPMSRFIFIKPTTIKGIVFGNSIHDTDKNFIINLVKNMAKYDIRLYEAKKDIKSGGMEYEEFIYANIVDVKFELNR